MKMTVEIAVVTMIVTALEMKTNPKNETGNEKPIENGNEQW